MTRRAGPPTRKGAARRLSAWLGVLVIGGSVFLFGAVDEGSPRTDADRVYSLAKNFGCPVCDGQSVAESDTVVARNIRQQIARRVDEGRSDDAIIAELEASFPGNDYTPAASGLSSLVWILPVVAGAGALAGLFVVFRRWRQEAELGATPADERLVAEFRRESELADLADPDGPVQIDEQGDA
ncbi:MAG: cytochrome c-type biogenesis protein CcmH [Acidimicrobiaceae bacterium]|nr:cytochrome c-type biogenesis protein CcmH [Acidimicrobiaceae bacterium]